MIIRVPRDAAGRHVINIEFNWRKFRETVAVSNLKQFETGWHIMIYGSRYCPRRRRRGYIWRKRFTR